MKCNGEYPLPSQHSNWKSPPADTAAGVVAVAPDASATAHACTWSQRDQGVVRLH